MDYKKIYDYITNNPKSQGGITERHHIIPKSLGGTDDPDNIVEVSPRVHYLLHLLLYKITTGEDKKKMWYAVWNMSNQGKIKTGAMYQFIREECSNRQREIKTKVPWNKGKKGYKINQRPQKGIPKVTSYKPIEYDGVIYQSIKEAVEKSGRSYYIVTTNGTRIQP